MTTAIWSTAAGYYLMGIPVNATTGNPEGSVPQVLQFNNNFIPAQETTAITYQANLPSAPTSGAVNPSDYANNPIAGSEIIGTGATLSPDAAATGTGTVGSLTDATTLASLGLAANDTVSIGDGTNTTVYTVTDTSTVGDLINAINSGGAGNAAVTASLAGGNIVLTGNNDTATISVSGSGANDASDLGFGAANHTFPPTNLLTQGLTGKTLTVSVGGGAPQTITFGTGAGDVATLAQLQTAVQGLTGVIGSVNTANGNVSLLATDPTATLTVGGTASPSIFGIQTPSVAPGNGTVIGSDLTTFTDQSIDGGSITAYDSEGNPLNIQFRWAQVGSGSGDKHVEFVLSDQFQRDRHASRMAERRQELHLQFQRPARPADVKHVQYSSLTVNGDTLGNVQVNFGTDGLTQFANTSGTAQVTQLQQNGFAAGQLQSVAVDSENRVVGTFSNGQTIPLAQITLATFNGEDSLQALNGGAYAATAEFRAADLSAQPARSSAVRWNPRTSISPPSSAI